MFNKCFIAVALSITFASSTSVFAAAPTCTINTYTDKFYSDTGVEIDASISYNSSLNNTIKWSSSSGNIQPLLPSGPVGNEGFVPLSGDQAVGQDLHTNPGFETSEIEYWFRRENGKASGSWLTDSNARNGQGYLWMKNTSFDDTGRWIKDSNGFDYTPDDNSYQFSVWIYAKPAANGTFGRLQVRGLNYRNKIFSGQQLITIDDPVLNTWVKYTVSGEVTWDEINKIRTEVWLNGAGELYIDDAYFTKSTALTGDSGFASSAFWNDTSIHTNGVTVSATVKNDDGQNTCSKVIYPKSTDATFELHVKETTDKSKSTLGAYCQSFSSYSTTTKSAKAVLTKNPGGTTYLEETGVFNTSFNRKISEWPTPGQSGTYGFSLDISDNFEDKEIKCIKHIKKDDSGNVVSTNIYEGSSLYSFEALRGGTETLQVVIGPKPIYPWFEAFGGQMYSYGGIENDIPKTLGTFFKSTTSIMKGALSSLGLVKVATPPDILITEYDVQDSAIQLIKTAILQNPEKVQSVNTLSAINANDSTKFYNWSGPTPLIIDTDIKRVAGKKTNVLFVDGDVEVTDKVKELNLYVVSTGKVTFKQRSPKDITQSSNTCATEIKREKWEEEIWQYFKDGTWNLSKATKTKTFTKPANANYLVIEAYWEWTGRAGDDTQKGENHWTKSIYGDTYCRDFGDSSLAGKQIYCGKKSKKNPANKVDVTFELDAPQTCTNPTSPCNASHKAIANIIWCNDSKLVQTQADPLIIYGGIVSKGVGGEGIIFERPIDNYDPIDYAMEQFYYQPEIFFSNNDSIDIFRVPKIYFKSRD